MNYHKIFEKNYLYCCNLISQIDIKKCYIEIREKYLQSSLQDFVISFHNVAFLSQESEKIVLKEILTSCGISDSMYWDTRFCYWLNGNNMPPPFKGEWWTNDNTFKGYGIFTLVKTIKRCSDAEAFSYVAEILKVNFYKKNVLQSQCPKGYTFVNDSTSYPTDFNFTANSIYEPPHIVYTFFNDNGFQSFYLLNWNSNGETVNLFYILCQNDNTYCRHWMLAMPPYKYLIYNRHIIDKHTNKIVYIHDNIADTELTNTDNSVGTWSGDISISKILDWSFLKGRTVRLVFDKFNIVSIKAINEVISNLTKNDIIFQLFPVSNKDYSKSYQDMYTSKVQSVKKLTTTNLCFFRMDVSEFYDFAKSHHGQDLKPNKINVKSFPTAKIGRAHV